jgi:hypothetical protein
MCARLGHAGPAQCPASPPFIFAVNVGAISIGGLCAIAWRRRNPMVGACALGVLAVNGAVHVGGLIALGAYNSGALSAALLFWPLCAWAWIAFRRAGLLAGRRGLVALASGGASHALLVGSLLLREHARLPEAALLVVNVLNGFVPLLLGARFAERAAAPARS